MTARELSAQQASELINPLGSFGFGIVTATPTAMLKALSTRDDWEDLRVSGGLVLGDFNLFFILTFTTVPDFTDLMSVSTLRAAPTLSTYRRSFVTTEC